MALFTMPDLRAQLRRGQRLVALDPGAKNIGVALSDASLLLASPYGTIRRAKLTANAAEITALAYREGAAALVIGYPLSMDGTIGPAAQAARDWALALSAATALPAALWDERLSSSAVNRFLIGQADLSRSKRATRVDSMAAAYTLQAALDATRPPDRTVSTF